MEELNTEKVEETTVETVTEQVEVVEDPTPSTEELVQDLKNEYEAKMLKREEELQAKIKERDNIIKQLLTQDKPKEETQTIADKINAKRIAQNKY